MFSLLVGAHASVSLIYKDGGKYLWFDPVTKESRLIAEFKANAEVKFPIASPQFSSDGSAMFILESTPDGYFLHRYTTNVPESKIRLARMGPPSKYVVDQWPNVLVADIDEHKLVQIDGKGNSKMLASFSYGGAECYDDKDCFNMHEAPFLKFPAGKHFYELYNKQHPEVARSLEFNEGRPDSPSGLKEAPYQKFTQAFKTRPPKSIWIAPVSFAGKKVILARQGINSESDTRVHFDEDFELKFCEGDCTTLKSLGRRFRILSLGQYLVLGTDLFDLLSMKSIKGGIPEGTDWESTAVLADFSANQVASLRAIGRKIP
jgi:hypothetical protein